MIESSEQLEQLIVEELDHFQIVSKDFLRPYLVRPTLHSLKWGYSSEPVSYPSWLVADLQRKDLGIFYSDYGHGTHDHWGVINISVKDFGMDDGWFLSLEDAIVNSGCWTGQLPEDYEIK